MKKSMKKLIFVICICIIGLLSLNVNAKEIYYTNGNVNLTKKEYDYVREFYGDEYLAQMDREDYVWLADLNIDNSEVRIKKTTDIDPNVSFPNDSVAASSNERVAISAACFENVCVMTILATWLVNPTVRSYDVIGARLYGTSLYSSTMATRVGSVDDGTAEIFSNYQNFSNGFGNSVKLLDKGTKLYVEQRFYVNEVGNAYVYGSYQHAVRDTTLAISKSYYVDGVGYGNVFVFTGKAEGVYNGFAGVDVRV